MADRDRIRVLTYSLRDVKRQTPALARVIRAIAPDVACLQDLPRHPFSGHRIGALAMECGLLWSGGGEPTAGTAVLTSLRVDQLRTYGGRLPVSGRLARDRGYASARVGVPAGPALTVASVRLGPRSDERVRDAALIVRGLRASGPGPYVVAGDLGESAGGPAWQVFAPVVGRASVSAPSLASQAPLSTPQLTASPVGVIPTSILREQEDALLVSEGLVVESLRAASAGDGADPADLARLAAATDRVPLIADLRVTFA